MLGPGPRRRAGLPRVRCRRALRRSGRRCLEAHGGGVRAGAAARGRFDGGRAVGVEIEDERIAAGAVISAVPWHALAGAVRGGVAGTRRPSSRNAAAMAARRSSPSTCGSIARCSTRRSSACPAGRSSGCSTRARSSAARPRTCRSCAAAPTTVVDAANEALVALAARRAAPGRAGRARARLLRGTAVRERRATFSLAAGEPPRPGDDDPRARVLPRRRLDRHRPARDHRERRRQRPPRRRAVLAHLGRRDTAPAPASHEPRALTPGSVSPPRPLPGDRAEGAEPAVVHPPPGPQPARRARPGSTSARVRR